MIFSLARTVPGTSYCFGSCFEVCTRKKHVRPLKTRAWNGSKREDDEEEEEKRGKEASGGEARCLEVPEVSEKERKKESARHVDRRETRPRGSTRRSKEDEREGPLGSLVDARGMKTNEARSKRENV